MASTSIDEYTPDVVAPPGDTLLEVLEDRQISAAQLAVSTAQPPEVIQGILQGNTAISADTARRLEEALGVPATFWKNLEQNYRTYLARRSAGDSVSGDTKAAAPR